jgi:hypothetical protein
MKRINPIPDSATHEECKDVALTLDFPGEITEHVIEQVVFAYAENREFLDLRDLKKHLRYVFGKRIGRIREKTNYRVRLDVDFNRQITDRIVHRHCAQIDLPFAPVTMLKRINPLTDLVLNRTE